MLRNVRGPPDLILVPRDEHAVAGHDQVGFDVIRALLDRQPIGFDGVFRSLAAGAAMSDDKDIGQGVTRLNTPPKCSARVKERLRNRGASSLNSGPWVR
jgi:hypothetical protein